MKRVQLLFLSLLSAVLLSLPWLKILPGWILLIALLPLLIIEDQLSRQREQHGSIVFFGYAYLCFFLWNAFTTWWIMNATIVGALLAIIVNAAFMATVWWLFHLIKRHFSFKLGHLSLVVLWISFEYLHFNWQIEWPWLTLGNGFSNQVKLVQWYEYTGVLGGSMWTLLVNLLFFRLYGSIPEKGVARSAGRITFLFLMIFVPVWISFRIYNHYRETGKSENIIVLQPNIDPYNEKFADMHPEDQMKILLELTDSLITDSTDYVVGPETALPPMWENQQMITNDYLSPFHRRALRHPRVNFILGATTQILFHAGEEMPETVRKLEDDSLYYDVYNTALQIGQSNEVQRYHKSILVPGVEKMPFSKYFSFIENFIIDLGGTTGSLGIQQEPSTFSRPDGFQVAPVICFESVFGEYMTKDVRNGARLIFVITNDGWWKNTPGYKQHLSFSRLRAIETRRSIARSANTGISALIDQRGEIRQQTGWWTKTAIKGKLRSNDSITFYVRYGDYIGRISSFMSVLLLLYYSSQRYLKKRVPY